MARRVVELNDKLQPVAYKATRSRRRSTQRLIPLTPAPKNAWQRFVREWVG